MERTQDDYFTAVKMREGGNEVLVKIQMQTSMGMNYSRTLFSLIAHAKRITSHLI